jgi:hypothetical protein
MSASTTELTFVDGPSTQLVSWPAAGSACTGRSALLPSTHAGMNGGSLLQYDIGVVAGGLTAEIRIRTERRENGRTGQPLNEGDRQDRAGQGKAG